MELVADLDEGGPVSRILEKNGPTPYHTCYAVDSLTDAVSTLRSSGYRPVTRAIPAVAFGERLVQFLHHPDSGLVELVEWP